MEIQKKLTGLELLENYPHTAVVVRAWFLEQMIESLKDENVPDDFKNFMRDQGIENDKLAVMIDANPRMLFDVFDENEVFIFIHYMDVKDNVEFFHSFRNIDTNPVKLFKTRKEAELFAIEKAFEILETKLTPVVQEIEVTGEEIVEQ
jgi:hypothetical protein